MQFDYKARRSADEILTGTLEADSDTAAAMRLKRLGYFPIEITRRGASLQNPLEFFRGRVGSGELALFARQMGTLVGSGVGLSESLALVSSQLPHQRLKEALTDARTRVEGGESFSEALGNHRRLFPPFLISVIAAGETGGMLAEVLDRAADHYESMEDLKGKVASALIYPAFLFFVGILSVGILVTFVVPRFTELFVGLGQALPLPTTILLAVSGFMATWWWAVIGGLLAAAAAFYRITRSGPGKLAWDSFKLEVPLYGQLLVKIETARFARTLSSLLQNGVPILQSLDVVANTVSNSKIAREVRKVREVVEQGSSLGEALRKHTDFADMAFSMVRVGESSGATPAMLEKIASVYQRDVDRTARALTTLLEPLLIVFMGGLVAFIVMSILLPVFRLEAIVQ